MSKENLEKVLSTLEDGSILVLEGEYKGKIFESAGVYFKKWQFCDDNELSLQNLSLSGVLEMLKYGGAASCSCSLPHSAIKKIYLLEKKEIYSEMPEDSQDKK